MPRQTPRHHGRYALLVLLAWLAPVDHLHAQSWMESGPLGLRRGSTPIDLPRGVTPLDLGAYAQDRRDRDDNLRPSRDGSVEQQESTRERSQDTSDTRRQDAADTRRQDAADTRRQDSDSARDKDKNGDKDKDDKDKDKPKDLEFAITIPVLWTSNALRASTETVVGGKPDVHTEPDVSLKWSHQYEWVKLSSSGGIGTDRYMHERQADESTVFWAFKASLTDGKSDRFVPYVNYSGTAAFEPDFSARTDIINDLAIGFTSGIGFRLKRDGRYMGEWFEYSDATDPGDHSIRLDLRLTRRTAEPSDLNHVQIQATVDYEYVISKEWSVSVAPRLKVRWYDDDVDGQKRRDIRPSTIVKAIWTPEWLTKQIPKAEIDFSLFFQRNFSTIATEEFTQWELGPTVVLAWKF